MPDKIPSILTKFGWRKFFSWLNMRFAKKQDRLRAGSGINITGSTISTAIPMVAIKNSVMFELIKTKSWQPDTLYLCINDENPAIWTLFYNGSEQAAFPEEWREYL